MEPMCAYDLREGTNKDGVYEDKTRYDLNGTQKTEILTSEFQKIVDKHNTTNPLFAYLSFHAVHGPIVITKNDIELIKNVYHRTPRNSNKKRAQILSMGTGMDRAIGRVVETLQRANMWENSIIMLTSEVENVPEVGPRDEILHHLDYLKTYPHRNLQDPREFLTPMKKELSRKGFRIVFHAAIRWKNWKLITGFHVFRDFKLEANHLEEHSHLEEEDPSIELGKLVALFEMTEDYQEFNDVSEANPEITMQLLGKLADYYQNSVPIRYPAIAEGARPTNFNNTWTPWIKTAEEANFSHPLQIEFYNMEIDRIFNSVDTNLVENSEFRSVFKLRKDYRAFMRKHPEVHI
ncbi:unnamed protein product [Oikopleura dioica]|uniref:Sulfatase N-terminal domain-containing protein n=1 Tax=Oikopleura dioica TaxID=34765 RepID=E4XSP0_OIKDI|nr:unnamed protein product [Oikopleura dioica]